MTQMNGQTKIIVATACALALVDIGVRLLAPNPGANSCSACPALSGENGVVTARAVRLIDNDGNVRGLWNTDENGEPALWMYDRNGATRIELDTTENTPSLSLHDTDGNRRVYFGMDNTDGTGLYQMMNPDADTVTFSISGSDNRPRIDLSGGGDYSQSNTQGQSTFHQYQSPRVIFAPGVQSASDDYITACPGAVVSEPSDNYSEARATAVSQGDLNMLDSMQSKFDEAK